MENTEVKTYVSVVEKLRSKLSREFIKERDGGQGRKLSYLEGWHVIDQLNEIIGHGLWSYNSETFLTEKQVQKDRNGNDVYYVFYRANVQLFITWPNGITSKYSDSGTGDGSDKNGYGKCHELAIKESITDALKRCAKNLGNPFGLPLYDKSQENVEDVDSKKSSLNVVPIEAAKKTTTKPIPEPAPKASAKGEASDLTRLVQEKAANIISLGKLKVSEVQALIVDRYKVLRAKDLSAEQSKDFIAHLDTL